MGFFCKILDGFISAPVDKSNILFISPRLIFGRKCDAKTDALVPHPEAPL
jgi:hypothetical protein